MSLILHFLPENCQNIAHLVASSLTDHTVCIFNETMLVKNSIEKVGRYLWMFPKHWHLSRLKTRISNFCRWKKTKHRKLFARKGSYLSWRCLYYSLSQTFCVLHCISQSTIVSKTNGKNSVEILHSRYACRPMKSRLKCSFFQPWLCSQSVLTTKVTVIVVHSRRWTMN